MTVGVPSMKFVYNLEDVCFRMPLLGFDIKDDQGQVGYEKSIPKNNQFSVRLLSGILVGQTQPSQSFGRLVVWDSVHNRYTKIKIDFKLIRFNSGGTKARDVFHMIEEYTSKFSTHVTMFGCSCKQGVFFPVVTGKKTISHLSCSREGCNRTRPIGQVYGWYDFYNYRIKTWAWEQFTASQEKRLP